MTYSLEIRHPAPVDRSVDCFVEERLELVAARARPFRHKAPRVIDQDLQWLRERLLFAYLAPGGYREDLPEQKRLASYDTSNTREAFPRYRAEQLAACLDENGRQVGRLPLDYVVSLARDTTRVVVSETRKKKTSANPLAPTAFDDARLIRVVAHLAPENRQWLRYAYADSREWADEAGATCALWALVSADLGKLKPATLQKLKGLAHLATQHGKRLANAGQDLYTPARLAQLLGVTSNNYNQHWRPRWQLLLEGVRALDRKALRAALLAYESGEEGRA